MHVQTRSFALVAVPLLALAACAAPNEEDVGRSEDALPVIVRPRPIPAEACRTIDEVQAQATAKGIPLGAFVADEVWGFGASPWAVRRFSRGAIIQVPGNCAAEIHGPLYDEYLRVGWQRLGWPTADVSVIGAASVSHLSADAKIIHRGDTGAHAFWGRIEREWIRRGGLLGLGVPVGTQAQMRSDFDLGGEFADFEHASLYDPNPPETSSKWLPGPARPLMTLSTLASLKYQRLSDAEASYFGPPSWDTKPEGKGSVTHFDLGGEIWVRPEGEAYALWQPIVGKYQSLGGEAGWLGWPRSDAIYDPNHARRCVFFDGGVICVADASGAVLVATSLDVLDRPSPALVELANYPNDDDYGWTNELQGVAHDDAYWYFTNREWLFRIPLGQNLRTSKDDWYGVHNPPGYDHFGDGDQHAGTLFVPVLGPSGWGIAIYDAVTLVLRGIARVPELPSDPPYCAWNPVDNKLYMSTYGGTPAARVLYAYDWTPGTASLRFSHSVPILHADGKPSVGLQRVQGGAFSPNGLLYLSVEGYGGWTDMPNGLLTFDVTSGRLVGTRSVEFHPERTCVLSSCYDSGEELEGVDFLDADGRGMPGIAGQIHLLMIRNTLGDDPLYIKHFTAANPAQKGDL